MSFPFDNIVNTKLSRTSTSQKTDTVILNETPTQQAFVKGKGTIWIRDDTPNVPVFTDDAGTDWVLNANHVLSVQDEAVSVVDTSTMNFAGSGVVVTENPAGTALVTVSSASGLSAVLTAGNDATGIDIVNMTSITFDTAANTKGITIGTDVAPATTVRDSQIAIGAGASCSSANNAGSIVIGSGATDSSSYIGVDCNNITIGTSASTSGTCLKCICVGDIASVSNSLYTICIGRQSSVSGAGSGNVAIGSSAAIVGTQSVVIGYNAECSNDFSVVLGFDAGSTDDNQLTIAVGSTPSTFRTKFITDTNAIPGGGTVALGNATAMLNITIGVTAYRIALFQ